MKCHIFNKQVEMKHLISSLEEQIKCHHNGKKNQTITWDILYLSLVSLT